MTLYNVTLIQPADAVVERQIEASSPEHALAIARTAIENDDAEVFDASDYEYGEPGDSWTWEVSDQSRTPLLTKQSVDIAVSNAAPDLLAALELALATIIRLKPPSPHDSTQGTRDVIAAAIARATQ